MKSIAFFIAVFAGILACCAPSYASDANQAVVAFLPERLVPNSSIEIVGKESDRSGEDQYILSSGRKLNKVELDIFRKVSGRFKNNPQLTDLMLESYLSEDRVENVVFISPIILPYHLSAYVGLSDARSWIRLRASCFLEDKRFAFVDSIKIAAGDYRWQSQKLKFDQETTEYSTFHESSDFFSDASITEMLRTISEYDEATLRFQGRRKNVDFDLTKYELAAIKKALQIKSIIDEELK